jgi:hypothetical protein
MGPQKPTGILNDKLDVKDGNDFALPLVDIDISIHANQLVQLSGDPIFLGLDLLYASLKEFFCPSGNILVDPVPIVGVMQDHFGLRRWGLQSLKVSKLLQLRL